MSQNDKAMVSFNLLIVLYIARINLHLLQGQEQENQLLPLVTLQFWTFASNAGSQSVGQSSNRVNGQ